MAPVKLLPFVALFACSSSAIPLLTGSRVQIGFYIGNGTSDIGESFQTTQGLGSFYSILDEAATSAFGANGFNIRNMTEHIVQTLTPQDFDVVVFPGGSGNGQATAIGEEGLEALRNFVAAGRGYMGTCGGAFLGLQHVQFYGQGPNNLGPPTEEPWDRGHGVVKVQFTASGESELGLPTEPWGGNVSIMYWQGPIVKDMNFPSNVTRLAYFRTEIHSLHTNKTKGEMINTPAITSIDTYGEGNGRVVLNSPHPELEPTHFEIYAGELSWVVKRTRSLLPKVSQL
eukprot:m.17344 g.17344  ORF g.17344 m.17344 type:complete len:285 (+) comp11463_c0_seq1:58-912(+)